ncbi:MAG: restriction endonuclease subunit S [Planctomycetota bacterium]
MLVTTKDGDWGKEHPEEGFVPYHIIRGTDFPYVRIGDLSSVPRRYLPEHTVKRRTLEPDDILIETAGGTRDRPTGRTLLITEKVLSRLRGPATCASFARFLRLDRKQADPRFVFWYLQYLYGKGEMSQHQVQHTGVARFQFTWFAETQNVPLPPLPEQKAIAAVLGALDDKIELNRRMNTTLEAMARALFQSWFVDFDPVRAKLDGRPPATPDPTTAALFPASFHDSAVGHIPYGWEVGVLDELTRFVIGGDWGATEATENENVSCYCIRGADIPSLQSGGVGKMPTRFLKPSSVEKRQLADGDLAIEISGGSPTQCTGRPVLASETLLQNLGQPLVASNFCRIVKLKSPALSKFVYLWLRRLYNAGELFQFETGTTGIKNFAFAIFSKRYPLVVPDLRVAEAFDHAVSPFFARIQENSHESHTLATLRDTLLPKLLSGELSVESLQN